MAGKKLLRPSQSMRLQSCLFSTQNQRQGANDEKSYSRYIYTATTVVLGVSILAYQRQQRQAFAEENQEKEVFANVENQGESQKPEPFYQKSIKEKLEIPFLLMQREHQKKEEYKEREEVDLKEIDKKFSKEDLKQMNDLDKLYGDWDKEQHQRDREEETTYVKDPYARQKQTLMRHQEYRILKVGSHDLLKNGQMIQVAVSDPFNETKYHETDKVIIAKHNDKYYAVGSFCGFDYTNLATGAFLGEKLICPTCGSNYNIINGFVEQGPSMRNISSFLIQSRENKVQIVIPEHVPAFAKKKFIERTTLDPRTFVVLGDSETALAAIDALRAGFTGRVVVVPSSPFGQFENHDILNKKFSPINKNESYMVEEDYFDRANIDVVKGEIKTIDLNKKEIVVKGLKKPMPFDKILIAWGANKKRLNQEYSNVFVLEDRQSHARCHNEILKAKTVVVMGGTFEAYQTAASIRGYLDELGFYDVEIIIIDPEKSEPMKTFGNQISDAIHELLKEKRISVIMEAEITRIHGVQKIEAIYFKKPGQEKNPREKNVEYFIKPDVIIAENGLGKPKYDLQQILAPATDSENNEPPLKIGISADGTPSSDIKFSLHYNDLFSPILAAGSCTQFPSFIQKSKIRTQDIKYNVEAGFFAAMSMMDKRVEFKYLPMSSLKIGETPVYFIGERNNPFHEVIINGSVEDKKFVAFFVYGNEITGIMTCGYQNLHLYLWEAMKLLIMPPATQLRSHTIDYKHIVSKVLQMRPYITCKRHDIVTIPSITLAEFDHELEKSEDLRKKVKQNIEQQNKVEKEKFKKMKAKYDRDGVEILQDELEMLEKNGEDDRARTLSGARKPGKTSTFESGIKTTASNINMGADEANQKNPFSMVINAAKRGFNGQ